MRILLDSRRTCKYIVLHCDMFEINIHFRYCLRTSRPINTFSEVHS